MRLDEAEEVLHFGSGTLWACDGEHKGSYGGEKEVDSHVLPLDFSVFVKLGSGSLALAVEG